MSSDVKKILNNILKNKNDAIAIFDFDYTITNKKSNSSIGVFTKYLPLEYQLKKQKIDNITIKTKTKFGYYLIWKYKLNLLSKYYSDTLINKINLGDEFYLNHKIYDLIIELKNNKIPIIIYSSGMREIIQKFLRLNNIDLSEFDIIANSIDLNTKKLISKIITPKNKKMFNIDKKYKYVFGDKIDDLYIVDDSIKFLVDDNNIKIIE